MQNNDLSIDLAMFTTSLNTLRENMTYVEFDGLLRDITRANDKGKLQDFLREAKTYYSQGTDLRSAFDNALFDIVMDQDGNF